MMQRILCVSRSTVAALCERRFFGGHRPPLQLIFLILLFSACPVFGATCESLATLKLPHATITIAQPVAPGAFTPRGGAAFKNLPAFCRVAASLKLSGDGRGADSGLHRGQHRYRSHREQRRFHSGTSRKSDRLLLSRSTRDDTRG